MGEGGEIDAVCTRIDKVINIRGFNLCFTVFRSIHFAVDPVAGQVGAFVTIDIVEIIHNGFQLIFFLGVHCKAGSVIQFISGWDPLGTVDGALRRSNRFIQGVFVGFLKHVGGILRAGRPAHPGESKPGVFGVVKVVGRIGKSSARGEFRIENTRFIHAAHFVQEFSEILGVTAHNIFSIFNHKSNFIADIHIKGRHQGINIAAVRNHFRIFLFHGFPHSFPVVPGDGILCDAVLFGNV